MSSKKLFTALFILVFSFIPYLFSDDGQGLSSDPIVRSRQLIKAGKNNDALKLLMTVRQKFPDSDWARQSYIMSAGIYEKANRYDDALAEYKNIIQKYPSADIAEESYFSIARIKSGHDQDAQAIKAFAAYLKNYPRGRYTVMALFDIATLYKQEGRHNDALKYFDEVLKNYPNEDWFYSWSAIYSGHIYVIHKDYNKAIGYYQMVIKKKDNTFLYTLAELYSGQAYMDKKEYASAITVYKDILKGNRYFQEEALYGMGDAHYKLGEFDMAKEVYISLLEMFPKTVWRDNVEKSLKFINLKLDKQRQDDSTEEL